MWVVVFCLDFHGQGVVTRFGAAYSYFNFLFVGGTLLQISKAFFEDSPLINNWKV